MRLSEFLTDNQKYNDLLQDLEQGGHHVLTGLTGSARSVYLSGLNQSLKQPMLLVTDSQFHAQQLTEDLVGLLDDEQVIYFPAEETLSAQIALSSLDTMLARITALEKIRHAKQPIIVTGYAGLNQVLPSVNQFENAAITIDFEQIYQLDQLQSMINTMGYRRVDAVNSPGEYSLRGSIIDVYPLNYENPIRMDFLIPI